MGYAVSYSGNNFATDLVELFVHQLRASALIPGETCLCVTDTAWNPAYAAACQAAAKVLGADAYQVVFGWNQALPERALAAVCADADLIVYMTSHRLHYHQVIGRALTRGARVLCCMEQPHVLNRLRASPDVRRLALAGAELLNAAAKIHITSAAGTDLLMDKTGRSALANYGVADTPGHLDFWGLGAVQAAQLEGSTEGKLVLDVGDCCFGLGRYIEQPVTIWFENGRVESIEGGLDAVLIRNELQAAADPGAWQAGHMAWGIDRRARWTQMGTQTPTRGGGGADSESSYGVIQVELGSNDDVGFGGHNRSRAHLGLCLRNANLSLDGRVIIETGDFLDSALRSPQLS